MAKIKMTQKSTGKTKVVSSDDAKLVQGNKHLAGRYKFEEVQSRPSEPKTSEATESEPKNKPTKPTNK